MNRKEIFDAVEAERKKQIMSKGYTASHDDQWSNGELAIAASVYAMPEVSRRLVDWPFGEKQYHPVPANRKKELIKAISLLVAEIDRISRTV